MKSIGNMILALLLMSTYIINPAHGACTPTTSDRFTGDDSSYFNITWNDALEFEDDFDLDRDSFGYYQGAFENRSSRYRRMLNGIRLLELVQYDRDTSLSWYKYVSRNLATGWYLTVAGTADCSRGPFYQSNAFGSYIVIPDSRLLLQDVVLRAGTIVHESRHARYKHNSNKCQLVGQKLLFDPDNDSEQCDSSFYAYRSYSDQVRFLISASRHAHFFNTRTLLQGALNRANSILQTSFESDPGFRLYSGSDSVVEDFQKKYWDCSTTRSNSGSLFSCSDSGQLNWTRTPGIPGEVEAAFFKPPGVGHLVITRIGIGMKNIPGTLDKKTIADDITTIAITWRPVLPDGSLGHETTEYSGRYPHKDGVQLTAPQLFSWQSHLVGVATGLLVRASAGGITALGVRYRYWNTRDGFITGNEVILWDDEGEVKQETNIRVANNHVLTGLGLRALNKNVHNAGFNQQMPLFTPRAGGKGGAPHLLRCPNNMVAIGVAANRNTSGYREVRFFGLLCA